MLFYPRIEKTIQKTLPAVVSVVIKKPLAAVEKELKISTRSTKKTDIAIQIPPDKIDSRGMVEVDGGSGFFVDQTGIILTNKHVVAEPESTYTVITSNGEEYEATLLARDPINDVAILKVDREKKFPFLPLGNSRRLRLGEPVLTFGNALGLFQNTVSLGIISGLSRSITAKTDDKRFQEMRGLIQTDAAINPGNSGGPLTDAKGRVIGINTAIIAGAQNICFAIPIHTAKKDLDELMQYGRIRRPLLGIHYLLVHKDLKEKRGLPVEYGALVEREYPFEKAVHPNGPADKGGIRERDILLSWNGKKITFEKSVLDYLEDSEVGDIVTFSLLRDGKELEAKVTLGERK